MKTMSYIELSRIKLKARKDKAMVSGSNINDMNDMKHRVEAV